MGRGPFDETRQSKTNRYPGNSRPGGQRNAGGRAREQGGYPPEDYDGRYNGYNRDHEGDYDQYGNRSYDNYGETPAERYYREQEARRRDTRNTGIKWAGIVLVALIAAVALILIAFAVTGGSADQAQQPQPIPQEQAQPAPRQAPQQAPQQVQPAPQAPQTPQAPAVPDNSQQIEGLRAEVQRQFAELQQSINALRLQIMAWWANTEGPEQ